MTTTTQAPYICSRTGHPHSYVVRQRRGGKRAGVHGTVRREYVGQGRWGAIFRWDATRFDDGTTRDFRTQSRAAEWVAEGAALPAVPVITGAAPHADPDLLRTVAREGETGWIRHGGVWAVIGPAETVVEDATVKVWRRDGSYTHQVIGEVHECAVDDVDLAWTTQHEEMGS